MSEPLDRPVPYQVSYSELVRSDLRVLAARAKARGLGEQLLKALQALDERLHVYPQFGEPLYNLKLKPAQIWIGAVPPLVARYILDEQRRLVMVVVPIQTLPNSGF